MACLEQNIHLDQLQMNISLKYVAFVDMNKWEMLYFVGKTVN